MTPTQREAMEQALEALDAMESHTPSLAETMRMQARAAKKLRDALAEQPAEQEPVAYVCTSSHVTADGSMEDGPDYLEWADEASDYEKRVGTPLYNSPQPAKREPLTDDEALKIWSPEPSRPVMGRNKVLAFARAIEAAHGITGETA